MTDWPVCRHGRFREGHCFRCEFEPKPRRLLEHVERLLDDHDASLSRVAWLGLLLAALYGAAHVAISF